MLVNPSRRMRISGRTTINSPACKKREHTQGADRPIVPEKWISDRPTPQGPSRQGVCQITPARGYSSAIHRGDAGGLP